METPLINKSILAEIVRRMDQLLPRATVDKALRQAGLSRRFLEGTPGYISRAQEARFAEALARLLGEANIGVVVGEKFRYRALQTFAEYVLAAPTLGQALERSGRGLQFVHPGCDSTLAKIDQHLVFGIDAKVRTVVGARHIDEFVPFVMTRLIRHFLGEDWKPSWVEMTGRHPRSENALGQKFDVPVRMGAAVPGIALEVEALAAQNPVPRAERSMMRLQDLPKLMQVTPPATWEDRVLAMLHGQIVIGDLSAEAVGQALSMGVRTLQRQLHDEGTSFRQVRERFLQERARDLLLNSDCTVDEIATALGYDETNSFRRAFRRWTGVSPTAFMRANGIGLIEA